MRAIILTALALAAFTVSNSRPSHAYGNGPWCAVSSLGRGGVIENCTFYNFEACRMEIIAGNRGFCRQNGYYIAEHANRRPVHRHHVHRRHSDHRRHHH